jgi:DNA polymerase-3 subunit epsilon
VADVSILIIDTETTGVNPREARIVQLAAYHMGDGPAWPFLGQLNEIIRPQGFMIPEEATAIHGIDQDTALRKGRPLASVLDQLHALAVEAFSDNLDPWLVAHNLNYDFAVLCHEFERIGASSYALTRLFPMCTMQAMTRRCNLPGKYPGKPKWPKLQEAYTFCFPEGYTSTDIAQAHTAMGDVLKCRDIYKHGWEQGWWGSKVGQ